jgi:hypothetical protein
MPLEAGDHVWIMFAEADFAAWRVSGSKGEPALLRRHGIFPFAIPGAFSEVDAAKAPLASEPGAVFGKLPSGPRLLVSSDGLKLGGCVAPTEDYVALAGLVNTALTGIKNAISNAPTTPQDGGAAFKAAIVAALSGWPPAVAATKVKAE